MGKDECTLDDNLLAAYLSNRLSKEERAAVTAVLLEDPDARELLKMALHALGAVDRPPVASAINREVEERLSRQPANSGGRQNTPFGSQD